MAERFFIYPTERVQRFYLPDCWLCTWEYHHTNGGRECGYNKEGYWELKFRNSACHVHKSVPVTARTITRRVSQWDGVNYARVMDRKLTHKRKKKKEHR